MAGLSRKDAIEIRNIQLKFKTLGMRVNWVHLLVANIIIHMTKEDVQKSKRETMGGTY